MSSNVRVTQDGGIVAIRLDRPDKKNAITVAMYQAMADALKEAERDDAVRVVLFCAEGDTFTAGNDLADFMSKPPTGPDSPVIQFLMAISAATKPLVAAVDGAAVGVGLTMLLHCDLVYASDRAQFRTPFVDLGLVPEAASSLLLPRTIGHQRAAGMLLLCDTVGADEAKELGFVNAIVPAGELEATARRACERLAQKPPGAVRLTKALMREPGYATVPERIAHEAQIFASRLTSPEVREAIMAFFAKRK
jgi:enoyl-CoA hydratase/carnithine racemase